MPSRQTRTVSLPDRAEVPVHDVPALLEAGAALLDVRELDEWDAGHAAAAVHVPLAKLSLDVVPPGELLLVVCHVGGRSAMATRALRNAGVPAANVTGGMAAWHRAGLPVVTADGSPGQII